MNIKEISPQKEPFGAIAPSRENRCGLAASSMRSYDRGGQPNEYSPSLAKLLALPAQALRIMF
jgi:hypothetical protein